VPDLAALQRRFAVALTDVAANDDVLSLFTGGAARTRDRLARYPGNISANTARALAATYPIIRKLVGDEFFDGLARAFCRCHPSASGDLNELGECFADFLVAFPHTQSLSYLPDVARLEWLVHTAHYAADHAPADTSRLATLMESDYPRLALKLHPAVATVTSSYPLCRIWEVHQDDYRGEIAVDLDGGADRVIVYRPQFRVTVAALTDGEFAFLAAVQRGKLLGTALESAAAASAQFDLGASLQRWTAANIVVGLDISRNGPP